MTAQTLVFIDDAHTFGGTQIALARTIQIVLHRTAFSVLCLCTARTRAAIESLVGTQARLTFAEVPAALPLNLFAFPIRLPAFWSLLRRVQRKGVLAWWLNLADIEFCLAPLLVLRAMGEQPRSYLHGTGRFVFFYRSAGLRRRLLSRVRDAVANRFAFPLHRYLILPSQASQTEVASRISARRRPRLAYLYPPIGEPSGLLRRPAAPQDLGKPLHFWMIGGVVQGHKNHRAALDLLEQLATATLTVAGDGPDLLKLQEEARVRGLADRITYLGWMEKPFAIVPPEAIVFIPSFHETMSLVAREAMQYGLRLVVAPIPVFHEWMPAALIAESFAPEAFAARALAVNAMPAEELEDLYRTALQQFSDATFVERFLRMSSEPIGPIRIDTLLGEKE